MNASAANGGLQSWPVNDDLPPIFDEVPAPPVPSSSSSSSSSDEDSDTSPRSRDRAARKILRHSEFYQDYMPATDDESDSMLKFCGSLLVRLPGMVVASLVRRITDYRFNWENKTLQSMLEIGCMISVTCAVYSLYHDWLFALEFGSFVGALVTIFDEVAQQCMRSIVRGIRNQSGGSELLLKLGFDIPKNGKAPTSGREIELLKTVVFGYLGLVAIRSLWTRLHDIMEFTLLTALVGVMFVMTAEFFCLWLPTRRIGLTLQSRFTRAGRNWQEHPYRSFFEIVFWTSSTIALYQTSQDFYWSARLGTIISVGVCLSSGLEELELPEVSDDEVAGLTFWQEHASTDPFLAVSDGLVKSHDALCGMWKRKAL